MRLRDASFCQTWVTFNVNHRTTWRILWTLLASSYASDLWPGSGSVSRLRPNDDWHFNRDQLICMRVQYCWSRGLLDDTQTIRWIIHPELKDLFITIVTTNPHVGLLFSRGDVCLLCCYPCEVWVEVSFECSHTDPWWGGGVTRSGVHFLSDVTISAHLDTVLRLSDQQLPGQPPGVSHATPP